MVVAIVERDTTRIPRIHVLVEYHVWINYTPPLGFFKVINYLKSHNFETLLYDGDNKSSKMGVYYAATRLE